MTFGFVGVYGCQYSKFSKLYDALVHIIFSNVTLQMTNEKIYLFEIFFFKRKYAPMQWFCLTKHKAIRIIIYLQNILTTQ